MASGSLVEWVEIPRLYWLQRSKSLSSVLSEMNNDNYQWLQCPTDMSQMAAWACGAWVLILGHQRGRVSGTALETTQNEEHHKLLKDSGSQNTEDKTAPQKVKTRGLVWLPKTNVLYLIFPNEGCAQLLVPARSRRVPIVWLLNGQITTELPGEQISEWKHCKSFGGNSNLHVLPGGSQLVLDGTITEA